MPKKTKRQKLIADLHRRTSHSSPVPSAVITDFKIEQPVFQLNKTISPKMKENLTGDAVELKIVKTDLYKTMILSFIIICFEIGAYWYLRVR
jgi:hypothetical protein